MREADENRTRINDARAYGRQGLPGDSSIPRFAERHGVRSPRRRRPLAIRQILAWADAFHARTGQWPTSRSGPIAEAPKESWSRIYFALVAGGRGLPRGWSLVKLFAQKRGVHSKAHRPRLTIALILEWADAHHDRHGTWPKSSSGPIPEAPGETWNSVRRALVSGLRGLPRGTTLPRLLSNERGVPNVKDVARFTVVGILAWADAYHSRSGKWPKIGSGLIPESPGDTWRKVQDALHRGLRGLEGGSSLAKFLAKERGVGYRFDRPDLTIPQIIGWADAFRARTGRWPQASSGFIPEAPGESWSTVDKALRRGIRGVPADLSLARVRVFERAGEADFANGREFESSAITATAVPCPSDPSRENISI